MGQQQLLLVILVTIIVGIATVVAINTFGAAADQANVDAVTQDVAQIAASAQGFYMKPKMLGGGGKDFTGITLNDISFAASEINDDGDRAFNENGVYEITSEAEDEFEITAYPASRIDGAFDETSTPSLLTGEESLTADIKPNGMEWGS